MTIEELPTCPPCLIYETYYRRENASGECRECGGLVRDRSCTLCSQCALREKACYFCGVRSYQNAAEWRATIERVVEKELQRLSPKLGQPQSYEDHEGEDKEENFRLLLREEWIIFLRVWRELLARNPSSERILSMRQEYLAAAEAIRITAAGDAADESYG